MAVADLKRRHVGGQAARVIVLGLWRYHVSADGYKEAVHEPYSDEYSLSSRLAYDVEVCDVCALVPRQQLRCVVSSLVYRSVRKGALVPGHVVDITDWKLVYDETQLNSPATTVIQSIGESTAIECTCGAHVHYNLVARLQTPGTPSLVGEQPLCLNAWTREDPVGAKRARNRHVLLAASRAECGVLLRGRTRIADLELGRATGPICGRILRKERLATYVPSKRPQRYPFFLHAELGDESGSIHVYFWHQMALACFDGLRENDVVVFRDFTVKRYVRDSEQFEIALNPCADPSDYVSIVPPRLCDVAGLVDALPAIRDNFVAVDDLYRRRRQPEAVVAAGDDEFCVVGLVVYVCAWQRYRDATVPDEFYQSRLLAVRDETSDRLVLLRVYAFSDEAAFLGLRANQLLVVTHCSYGRMGSEELLVENLPSRLDELMVVSTSANSQVYTFERSGANSSAFEPAVSASRFEKDEKVLQTAHWLDVADNSDAMCLQLTAEDLCHDRILPLPVPLDIQLDVLKKVIELKHNFQVVSGVRLCGVLSDLDYRESRLLFVHATLSSVSVTCFLPSAAPARERRAVHSAAYQADGEQSRPRSRPVLSRPASATSRPYELRTHGRAARRRLIPSSSDDDDSAASHEYLSPVAHRKRHGDVVVASSSAAQRLPRELRAPAAQRSAGQPQQLESRSSESGVNQRGEDNVGVMTRGQRARLQTGALAAASGDSDTSSVYRARPNVPLVPASHSDGSDEDTRLPHLRRPLLTSLHRSNAVTPLLTSPRRPNAVASNRGMTEDSGLGVSQPMERFDAGVDHDVSSNGHSTGPQAEGTFTKRTMTSVLHDIPDDAERLDCCAGKPASEDAHQCEVTLQLLTLNEDVAVHVPLRYRHALSCRYRLAGHDDDDEVEDATDVLCRGQAPRFEPTEDGMRLAVNFVETLKSRVSGRRLLVMLDAYRTSCAHVHVTFMGAFLNGEL